MKYFGAYMLVLSAFGGVAYATSPSSNIAINLGTAGAFGVLAGSGVTNVSAQTLITGNVGSSPTPAVTGLLASQVIGTLYLNPDPATAQAQVDLTVAYAEAVAAPCGTDLTGQDLGGMTLIPGVYCFSSSALLTGTLTLDGQGASNPQWIFQMGSTLTTATGSTVSLINGAAKCNVFWQVGSSATIQTGNVFVGTILALTSITLDGGTLNGRALASNGAVTMAAQETITNSGCDQCTVFVTNPTAGSVTKVVFSASGIMQTVIATGMTSAENIVCSPDQNLHVARSGVYGGPAEISTIDQYGWAGGNILFSRISGLASSGGPGGLAFQDGTGAMFFTTTLSNGFSNTGIWQVAKHPPVQAMEPFAANGGLNGGGAAAFLTAGPYAGDLIALDTANQKIVRIAPPFTAAQEGIDFITTNLVGPGGLAVNPAGNIFVTNSDGTVQQFGTDGTYLGLYANTGLHNMNIASRQNDLFVATLDGPVIWIRSGGKKTTIGTVPGGDGVAVCARY